MNIAAAAAELKHTHTISDTMYMYDTRYISMWSPRARATHSTVCIHILLPIGFSIVFFMALCHYWILHWKRQRENWTEDKIMESVKFLLFI